MEVALNNGIVTIDLTDQYNGKNKIYKVYIDNVCNDNYVSIFDDEHDNVYEEEHNLNEIISIDLTKNQNKAYIVTIYIHDDETQEDSSIVRFTIDEEYVYYSIVNMLVDTCNNCVSRAWKDKTLMCYFRLELLKQAMQLVNIKDCISLYLDLLHILGMNDKAHYKYITNSCKATCNTCSNNYCHCSNRCNNKKNVFNNLHRWIDVV